MSEVFFIGDTHFGHRGILKYEPEHRPFKDVDEMNDYLIAQWNKVVSPNDIVWHLGDVAFGKRYLPLIGECNGKKKLVLGNHDMYGTEIYLKYFNKVAGAVQYQGLILTHIPVHPAQLTNRYWGNVHGHLHSKTYDDARYINVSCEQLPNLAPIPFDEVINRATDYGTTAQLITDLHG